MLRKYINSVQEIERLYDFLNEKFFESALSKPVITLQPDEKCHALGWFIPYRIWKDGGGYSDCELNISANFLDRNVEDIVATLLHEMCHQYAFINNIKDCCRRGHYHNKNFARIAKAHGLEVRQTKDRGFAATRLSEEAKRIIGGIDIAGKVIYRKLTEEDIYEDAARVVRQEAKKIGLTIDEDSKEFVSEVKKRIVDKQLEKMLKGRKPSSTRKYICNSCGQSVRATREVDIICGKCNQPMVVDTSRR